MLPRLTGPPRHIPGGTLQGDGPCRRQPIPLTIEVTGRQDPAAMRATVVVDAFDVITSGDAPPGDRSGHQLYRWLAEGQPGPSVQRGDRRLVDATG